MKSAVCCSSFVRKRADKCSSVQMVSGQGASCMVNIPQACAHCAVVSSAVDVTSCIEQYHSSKHSVNKEHHVASLTSECIQISPSCSILLTRDATIFIRCLKVPVAVGLEGFCR